VQHELELIIALTSVCIEPVAATAKRMPKDDPVNIGEKQLGKSAFEITKGTRQVMTLSEREVESILICQNFWTGSKTAFGDLNWE